MGLPDGKLAIVTGAGGGLGRAHALLLASEGAAVVVNDLGGSVDGSGEGSRVADQVVAEIEAAGGRGLANFGSVTNAEDAQAMVDAAVETFGRLDILINNVGGTIWAKPFEHYAEPEIEAEVRRSLFPTLWCCHCVLPYMLEQGSGAIVHVSSIATRRINRVPYGAAKGGVNALPACPALETAGHGIRINATAPGGTEAPPRRIPRNSQAQSEQERVWYQQIVDQTLDSSPMKRYGSIDEQVGAILFLASHEASYITGVTLPVGGGDLG